MFQKNLKIENVSMLTHNFGNTLKTNFYFFFKFKNVYLYLKYIYLLNKFVTKNNFPVVYITMKDNFNHYRRYSYIPLTVINFTNKAKSRYQNRRKKINKTKFSLLNMTQLQKAFITQQSH